MSPPLILRTCRHCQTRHCVERTSSNLAAIVLLNKGLPLPSSKCFEAHAGNVKLVLRKHSTGNNFYDSAICVTQWLLANNDKCSNIILGGLEGIHWKFRSG